MNNFKLIKYLIHFFVFLLKYFFTLNQSLNFLYITFKLLLIDLNSICLIDLKSNTSVLVLFLFLCIIQVKLFVAQWNVFCLVRF